MLKVKLISSTDFYRQRKWQVILFILLSLPISFLSNFFQIPVWGIVASIGGYALIAYLLWRFQKRINGMIGDTLEMGREEWRLGSGKNFPLDDAKIIVKNHYGMQEETVGELFAPKENYIILERSGSTQRFDFLLESHYAAKRLQDLISVWESRGWQVERR